MRTVVVSHHTSIHELQKFLIDAPDRSRITGRVKSNGDIKLYAGSSKPFSQLVHPARSTSAARLAVARVSQQVGPRTDIPEVTVAMDSLVDVLDRPGHSLRVDQLCAPISKLRDAHDRAASRFIETRHVNDLSFPKHRTLAQRKLQRELREFLKIDLNEDKGVAGILGSALGLEGAELEACFKDFKAALKPLVEREARNAMPDFVAAQKFVGRWSAACLRDIRPLQRLPGFTAVDQMVNMLADSGWSYVGELATTAQFSGVADELRTALRSGGSTDVLSARLAILLATKLETYGSTVRNGFICSSGEDFKADLKNALLICMRPGSAHFHPDTNIDTSESMQAFLDKTYLELVTRLSGPISDDSFEIDDATFRRQKKLATGGAGAVWLYREEGGQRQVAVKEPLLHETEPPIDARTRRAKRHAGAINTTMALDLASVRMDTVLRDARAHLKANAAIGAKNPHVMDLLAVLRRPDGAPLIVMEYAPFGDAAQFPEKLHLAMGDHSLPPSDLALAVRMMVRDMLTGVGHLHDAGMMHLDIKPANFLVGADGRLKLTDFGLAEPGLVRPGESPLPTQHGATYIAPEMHASNLLSADETFDSRRVDTARATEVRAAVAFDVLTPELKKLLKRRAIAAVKGHQPGDPLEKSLAALRTHICAMDEHSFASSALGKQFSPGVVKQYRRLASNSASQSRATARIDRRTMSDAVTSSQGDVWSIGICACEMLSGARPFGDWSELAAYGKAHPLERAALLGLSDLGRIDRDGTLTQLVSSLLDPDPRTRPTAHDALRLPAMQMTRAQMARARQVILHIAQVSTRSDDGTDSASHEGGA